MTATQREGLSDAALALTQPVIDELLKDIARRIKDAGAITDTAEYQIYRAQALGESKQAIKAAVARQIKAQDKVIDSLFDYILDNSTPLTANGSLKQIAEGYAKMSRQKTAEQLKNLWADTPQGKVLPIQDAYAKALDFAFRQTVTGALDTETAIRRACAPLAKRGLRTIEQKSGRSVGIEYACRRYLMDQLGELDDEVQQVTHDELGCDGWEISAHLACAPDHEPYQGRQYSDAEYEKLNNSLQRRIGHLNCGHTASPIILGVNAPQYTEEQLRELADANERGVTYNGQHYTLYEAGQEQSRLENAVRTCKRHILMNRETGDAKNLKNNQIRLRVLQSEYGKFCKATGLPTRTERLQTAGFGRSEANKAVWEYKKSSGTKASDLGGQALHTVTDEAIQAVPKPFFRGLSNKANTAAQGYARDLLTKVKDLPLGTEATVSFTEDGQCSWEVGDLKEMRVKVKDLQVPYYSLHNHASNGILSPEDIFQLAKHDNMKGIGAVGHDGALHTCEKVFGYKKENFNRWMDGLLEKYPLYQSRDANKVETALKQRIDLANELRQDGDKHGLRFSG